MVCEQYRSVTSRGSDIAVYKSQHEMAVLLLRHAVMSHAATGTNTVLNKLTVNV